jgi:hypothetical protein
MVPDEVEVVLISVKDFVDDLWEYDGSLDFTDLEHEEDDHFFVLHGYDEETYTPEVAEHVFYQLTPEAVERLGPFN